jgi:hypothetical protein
MTSYVIRQATPAGATKDSLVQLLRARIDGAPASGPYLEWFNVDANNGRGADSWTHDVTKAMRFPSFKAAMECLQSQSTVTPLRSDGRPNRPLTAYNVTIEQVP